MIENEAPLAAEPAEPPAPPPVKVAVLDEQGVYLGMAEMDAAVVTKEHVQLPAGCDLPAGKYAWNADLGTFEPIKVLATNEKLRAIVAELDRLQGEA